MTGLAQAPARGAERRDLALPSWTVAVAALAAVLARIPSMGHAPGADEAGFLLVGGQWDGAGSSLYGDFWVDRPPLLMGIFRLASMLGGLTALRALGAVAVLLLVVGSARLAGLLGGAQAARWSAVTASALCVTPVLGGYLVNGELFAAPFILGGVVAFVHARRSPGGLRAAGFAALAGTLAVCALLIKQNMADAAVFGVVTLLVSWHQREITRRHVLALAASTVVSVVAVAALIGLWTVNNGTSLSGVFDAMYPFRLRASHVLVSEGQGHATARLLGMLGAAGLSGLGLLVLLLGMDTIRRPVRSPAAWGLVAMVVFAGTSVLAGGNYWHHYLIELVAPVSVVAGLLVVQHRPLARPVVAYAVVAAAVGWSVSLTLPQGSPGATVGTAIGAASRSGDSVVSAYGHADIVQTSGLSSPYAYLWSLPVKTLDPHLTELNAVLNGPSAPTWVVTGNTMRSWGLDTARANTTLTRDYHAVSTICGRTIHLRDGLDRPAPRALTTCSGADAPIATLKEIRP